VHLLLENTAGQGTEIGYQLNHLQAILEQVRDRRRVGFCLDTAHAFQAGYDLATAEGLDRLLEKFDTLIGLDKLKVLHLNDSRSKSGSRADRHWHIGEGEIGVSGFKNIVNHAALVHLPGIMETPRKTDADDLNNMAVMRSLINEAAA
jgi:deoxyribonuclease-4